MCTEVMHQIEISAPFFCKWSIVLYWFVTLIKSGSSPDTDLLRRSCASGLLLARISAAVPHKRSLAHRAGGLIWRFDVLEVVDLALTFWD